ncbi:MAG: YihY/virulence factor BrkB family protein [Candidatus Eremiobacteraeota bacterium]|nr:YihY/virulence factor BrkB family protein [Candidatus Eremiobacteraeota bacterium]
MKKNFLSNLGASFRTVFALLRETALQYSKDGCAFMAAGIAFYLFLCIIPLFIIFTYAMSIFISPALVIKQSSVLSSELSPYFNSLIQESILRMQRYGMKFSFVGFILLAWSARQVFLAMEHSLNKAWNIEETRSYLQRNLMALLLIPLVGAVFSLSVLYNIFVKIVPSWGFLSFLQPVPHSLITRFFFIPFSVCLAFSLLFMILPNRKVSFLSTIPGALLATAAWKASEMLYFLFLRHMAHFSIVYGSMAGVIGLLFWLLVCSNVYLVGGEFTSVYVGHLEQKSLREGRDKSPTCLLSQ